MLHCGGWWRRSLVQTTLSPTNFKFDAQWSGDFPGWQGTFPWLRCSSGTFPLPYLSQMFGSEELKGTSYTQTYSLSWSHNSKLEVFQDKPFPSSSGMQGQPWATARVCRCRHMISKHGKSQIWRQFCNLFCKPTCLNGGQSKRHDLCVEPPEGTMQRMKGHFHPLEVILVYKGLSYTAKPSD